LFIATSIIHKSILPNSTKISYNWYKVGIESRRDPRVCDHSRARAGARTPTRNSDLSTTTLILYTVFLPLNKEGGRVWYPVRVWAGTARLHAVNVFINLGARAGQNQQPSCYIVFEGCLVYPSPDSGYLTKCTYGRMCRSIKWPAYALSILPETQTVRRVSRV